MVHLSLFVALYLGLLPVVSVYPFAGALLYHWLDDLPPDLVYSPLLPDYLSLTIGALTFLAWALRERKTLPRPFTVMFLMIVLLAWMNVTWHYAQAPGAGALKWDRTLKVVGFAALTAQMLSTRARLEPSSGRWFSLLFIIPYRAPSNY